MFDLIGWGRATSTATSLSAFVSFDAGEYSIHSQESPWLPQPGDVFTDSAGLVDTVVSVDSGDPNLFNGINNFAGWADGFATIVRKTSSVPASVANFRGIARAFDNPVTKSTDLVLNSGNSIADDYSSAGDFYAPEGFGHASIIEVNPTLSSVAMRAIFYHAPQGVKILWNVNASTNDFEVFHNQSVLIPETAILTTTGQGIIVRPGESVAIIRDNVINRWRCGRNSPDL